MLCFRPRLKNQWLKYVFNFCFSWSIMLWNYQHFGFLLNCKISAKLTSINFSVCPCRPASSKNQSFGIRIIFWCLHNQISIAATVFSIKWSVFFCAHVHWLSRFAFCSVTESVSTPVSSVRFVSHYFFLLCLLLCQNTEADKRACWCTASSWYILTRTFGRPTILQTIMSNY